MIRSLTSPSLWTARLGFVAVAALLWAAPAAPAQRSWVPTKTSPRFLELFRDVVAEASRSTVHMWRDEPKAGASGYDQKPVALGVVVAEDGWVLTKASELNGKLTCQLHDGREPKFRIVGVSEPYDLAMLKLEVKGLKPVVWHDSNKDAVGSWVATPGMSVSPVAVGVISVSARKISGRELARRGINSGFLGIGLARVQVKDGVKIDTIIPDGAAERAGFEKNDIIVAVGKSRITDPDSLLKAMDKTRVGQEVTVRVKRGSEEVDLKPTLGRRTEDRADFQNQLGSKLSDRRGGFPIVLQHDTVLDPADCGGPLVDLDGKVIGINIARAGRTETLAIPAEVVKTLLDDLKSGKLAPPK